MRFSREQEQELTSNGFSGTNGVYALPRYAQKPYMSKYLHMQYFKFFVLIATTKDALTVCERESAKGHTRSLAWKCCVCIWAYYGTLRFACFNTHLRTRSPKYACDARNNPSF